MGCSGIKTAIVEFTYSLRTYYFPKTLSNHHTNNTSDDGSRDKFREPVDTYRNTQTDPECVKQSYDDYFLVLWVQHDKTDHGRKSDRGMRRRPAPEDSASQEAELEAMAGIDKHAVNGSRFENMWRGNSASESLVN